MTYGRMPLFPPACAPQSCVNLPLFDGCGCCRKPREDCQCVRVQNPACPGEFADVELCVDEDGNLSICVRRQNRSCCPPPRKPGSRCNCHGWMR